MLAAGCDANMPNSRHAGNWNRQNVTDNIVGAPPKMVGAGRRLTLTRTRL